MLRPEVSDECVFGRFDEGFDLRGDGVQVFVRPVEFGIDTLEPRVQNGLWTCKGSTATRTFSIPTNAFNPILPEPQR
jgi:hypothetical protein